MSNKISRRNFLHTAGLGTLGAAAAGLLTACGDKAASGSVASSVAAAGTYTAGTYSATATGINTTTPVTVTMTFSADAITDVQIDREIVTVLRATHKYKDSREQFESRTHKRLIDILKPSNKTVEALMSLQLPAGVDIEIKL